MKNFANLEDNFEVESRAVEFGLKPEMTFNDLEDSDKALLFSDIMELTFTMEDALELTR